MLFAAFPLLVAGTASGSADSGFKSHIDSNYDPWRLQLASSIWQTSKTWVILDLSMKPSHNWNTVQNGEIPNFVVSSLQGIRASCLRIYSNRRIWRWCSELVTPNCFPAFDLCATAPQTSWDFKNRKTSACMKLATFQNPDVSDYYNYISEV